MKKLTWILVVVFTASLFIWGFAISQEKPKTTTPSTTAEKQVTKPAKADTAKEVTKAAKADTAKEVTKAAKADTAEKAKEHAYVGIDRCKMCHNQKNWGKIYDKWAATKHATAYATLANKESQAIAKKMKIEDAQKSEKCLVCHVTGYEASAKLKGEKYSMEEGVTCEACHGPAGDYLTSHIKKDNKKQAMADGLIIPTEKLSEELCVKCHNKQSPTYQEFKYKEAVKLVEHHKPTAEELKKEEAQEEKSEGK